jgi:hypothetical protein
MPYTISPNRALLRLASQSTLAILSCPNLLNVLPTLPNVTMDLALRLLRLLWLPVSLLALLSLMLLPIPAWLLWTSRCGTQFLAVHWLRALLLLSRLRNTLTCVPKWKIASNGLLSSMALPGLCFYASFNGLSCSCSSICALLDNALASSVLYHKYISILYLLFQMCIVYNPSLAWPML